MTSKLTRTAVRLCVAIFVIGVHANYSLTSSFAQEIKYEDRIGSNRDWQWREHGGDPHSRKYAPIELLNRGNVNELCIAWKWESPDNRIRQENPRLMMPFLNESTPLFVDGVLYVSTSYNLAAAIDSETGQTIWEFDPEVWRRSSQRPDPEKFFDGMPPNWGFVHRGLSYWQKGNLKRLFLVTGNGYLIALDTRDGKPIESFGERGLVDLTQGLSRQVDRVNPTTGQFQYGVSSPPAVCGDVLVVGSNINDPAPRVNAPPGDVRGFDAFTGKQLWNFSTIPIDGEYGSETWEDDSGHRHGNGNVWSLMSYDPKLGLVYLPIGAPTNDYYGGSRPGDNLFTQSVVALRAATGERVWHFQTTHHGVWDYDVPAAPVLGDINVSGKKIEALMQVTKQGFVFALDRATGEPVWPVEEKTVPIRGRIEGEQLSPTQPFPTSPRPFERQGVVEENIIDFTPELKAAALQVLEEYHHGPLYTPPSKKGTLMLPGRVGGANWGGAAFDPETGRLYVPSQSMADLYQLAEADPDSGFDFVRVGSAFAEGPKELPLTKPPYGSLTCIDMNSGEHVWRKTVGEGLEKHPALMNLDLPSMGTPRFRFAVVTKGGLCIVSEGRASGREMTWWGYGSQSTKEELASSYLRIFDKEDGSLLWEYELPGPASALPMTYVKGGKQHIAVSVGGMGTWKQELISFSVP